MNPKGTVYNAMGRINRLSVLCIDAYGVAVKNGFEGTVEEWLASLKGEKGDKGVGVMMTSQSYVANKIITEIRFTDGSTQTIRVTNGTDGADGVDGTAMYTFDADEALSNGKLEVSKVNVPEGFELKAGDLLLATNGDVYTADRVYAIGGIMYGEVTFAFSIRGNDGKTPEKGKDYYTEEEKTEMVNSVLAALPTWNGGSY